MIVQRRFFISAPALLAASLFWNRTGAAAASDFEESQSGRENTPNE
jgi:hypothetical protein